MNKGFLLALGLVAASFTAPAATITQFYSIGPSSSLNTTMNVNTFLTEALNQGFNASTFTLNSVRFDLTTAYSVSGDITNKDSKNARISATVTGSVLFNNQNGNDYDMTTSGSVTYFNNGVLGNVNNVSNPNRYTPGQTKNFGPTNLGNSKNVTLTSGDDFNTFAGAGVVEIPVVSTAGSSSNGDSSNVSINISSGISANLTVTYDYTIPDPPAVPEPSTMALSGMSIVGLGFYLRRRRS